MNLYNKTKITGQTCHIFKILISKLFYHFFSLNDFIDIAVEGWVKSVNLFMALTIAETLDTMAVY